MDFNIYTNIYEELINTKNNLNSRYFINKYSLSEIELKTILIKIKENEYISKDNKILKDILSELEDYEIDFSIFTKINNNKKNDLNIQSNKPINKIKIKDKMVDFISNFIKELRSRLENINLEKKQYIQLGIGFISIILIFSITTYIINSKENTNTSSNIEKENITTNNITNEKKLLVVSNNIDTIKINNTNTEKKEEDIISSKENSMTVNVEDKLDSIKVIKNEKENSVRAIITYDDKKEQKNTIQKQSNTKNSNTKLVIRTEFNSIKDDLKYENHMIKYKNKYYKENDILEGYKIFKITPAYVKFEDTKTNIRKRVLLN
ncbi:hypothetical protein CPU12_09585 [Malaciobacter molluscorum LMG 25693]|uniref:Uncharacterized protein n=1 Tax=Malaciobacter molluscorum LMG 25693 TaxID=870501 RepID=A0A2G1DGS0_9BACT|nr:hypothetical protein [Malaciobacter molluscorum]AXX92448.1 hypothetical protein AMOL_1478 [Malaciobacter molluscorum LMG 25693]PHO17681.1 hypothetical protein CPU12_09585 [Malaciobacter molluscorum LMG 25693]